MDDEPTTTERAARERIMAARVAAHVSWSLTSDREARTRPARAAFLARSERQVDPDNLLSPQERHLRAESAKRAYFRSLTLKSARPRRRWFAQESEAGSAATVRDDVPSLLR